MPNNALNFFERKFQDSSTMSSPGGFTLLEVLVVVVIIGVLAVIAMFAYNNYITRARIIMAVAEMRDLEEKINVYSIDNQDALPVDLAAIGYAGFNDPWGNVYVYQPDLSLNPRTHNGGNINTDYDLYSRGEDGLSAADIDAAVSQDDVIRADNGSFKGMASRYE